MSGISQQVCAHVAANIIGIQVETAVLSGAVIPGLMGALAHQVSLKVIFICLVLVL
jgi:fucose permease